MKRTSKICINCKCMVCKKEFVMVVTRGNGKSTMPICPSCQSITSCSMETKKEEKDEQNKDI